MIGFLVERNEDDTLSVWFSDKYFFNCVEEEEIDNVVFGYKPDVEKVQAYSEDELYTMSAKDDQCH